MFELDDAGSRNDENRGITEEAIDAVVLLISDDPGDADAMKRMLSRAPIRIKVEIYEDTKSAITHLGRCLEHGGPRQPDLILLDLDLPMAAGYEFLKVLRGTAALCACPVCALTSTDVDSARHAYEAGANAVVSKASNYETLSEILNVIVDFWFKTAQRYYV